MVSLNATCSSIVTSSIASKLKDPGSFTIPCHLGKKDIPRCLCDLGASINLIPLSLFREIELGEVISTNM